MDTFSFICSGIPGCYPISQSDLTSYIRVTNQRAFMSIVQKVTINYVYLFKQGISKEKYLLCSTSVYTFFDACPTKSGKASQLRKI